MAQTNYTPILLYASGTATNVPLAANLTSSASGAELALNYADGKLFYKDNSGTVQVLATKGAGTIGGSNTQVQYNNSGTLAGSANLTFNGTTVTIANDASISGLTVGRGAGAVSTNTAVGASALAANTSGSNNTAVGYQAGYSNTTGIGFTAIGYQSLYNTTGSNSTAVGIYSLKASTTGTNVAMGYSALSTSTTGTAGTAIGTNALQANTTGSYNTALGDSALYSNTTASNNTAVGYQAGYSNTTGLYNTFVGTQDNASNAVGRSNTIGWYNAAFGAAALQSNVSGYFNVAIGAQSLYVATGSNNTGVGYGAGSAITTGAYNTILGNYNGNQGGLDIRTANNYIVLSDGQGNPRGVFDSSGNFGVGTDPSSSGVSGYNNLVVGNSSAATSGITIRTTNAGTPSGRIVFARGTGGTNGQIYYDQSLDRLYCQAANSNGVYLAGGGVAWIANSDERLKENLLPITDAINKVSTLRAVTGNYIADADKKSRSFLIAQDVQSVLPEAVDSSDPQRLGVAYSDVIPLLVAAIKELKAEFDAYKATHP